MFTSALARTETKVGLNLFSHCTFLSHSWSQELFYIVNHLYVSAVIFLFCLFFCCMTYLALGVFRASICCRQMSDELSAVHLFSCWSPECVAEEQI